LRACANWPMVSWFFEQWISMQGEVLLNNDNGRNGRASEILLDTPAVHRILEFWKAMSDNGYYVYSGRANDYLGEGITFLGQTTSMIINSSGGMAVFQSYNQDIGIDFGYAPLFTPGEDATQGVTVGGASLFVTGELGGASQEEIQASIEFVFYMTNPENLAKWHTLTGYYPPTQGAMEVLETAGWFTEHPEYRIAVDQALNTEPSAATAGSIMGPAAEVRGILVEMIQSIVDGGEDIDAAIEGAKGRIDAVLADYNSLVE
jgi:sn-glycerol 3-phosphate transport system substrate-binding protein